ncbi:hypothetical protein NDO71_orf187 [Klebsiella phage vB_KpnM_NDO71]|nr:hypothetical protein NDO71_orf187 [Klebsiella phage vB_KpnM_NDO71]
MVRRPKIKVNEMKLSQQFAQECREEAKYYFDRALQAKAEGLNYSRRVCLQVALLNRKNARKWAAE